jgi:hypothetical protein
MEHHLILTAFYIFLTHITPLFFWKECHLYGGIEKKLIGEHREMELMSVEPDPSADSNVVGAWQARCINS